MTAHLPPWGTETQDLQWQRTLAFEMKSNSTIVSKILPINSAPEDNGHLLWQVRAV
jgi:hypothetical protein